MQAAAPRLGDDSPAGLVVTGLAKIGLVLRHEAWQDRGATGLTPTQGQILALLAARGQPAALSELAAELGVSAPTASDSVAALAAKGLVSKARGRTLAIALTAAGRREAERAARWPDVLLEAVDALSPEEQAVFLRGLTTMIRVLQERGRIPVARMCATCSFFRPNVHDDPERPHHCAYADVPFGDRQLRLDCADWRAPDAKEDPR
ncbi:MAG TPA: MarR family winged helix-turn-helix transcriptional regulator [Gaiellaceae bacterium]|nr:MarR family winged helix-turn-helix transcriptional regulator [Gaiellaceae bacterium]